MGKIINAEPAKYPKGNTAESDSLAIFNYIIDCERVKTHDLKQMDKIPSYDGTIAITTKDQTPLGKLETQMKKLPSRNEISPKYQCDKKFLSACEQSVTPVLLILVDTKNEVAYWQLMDRNLLSSLQPKESANSVNVDVPKKNIIKKGNTDYIEKWIEIIEEYKERIFSYDSIKHEIQILQGAYNELAEKTEESLGEENDDFIEIHKFLDELNYKVDRDYPIIKTIYFDSTWKLGFAYADYKSDSVTYSLYPIRYNKNDLQIKRVSREKFINLSRRGFGFTGHYQENPLKTRVEEYTNEWIFEKLKPLFENNAFPIKNQILAREFIFAFIKEFKDMLDLSDKDTYRLDELTESLQNTLPLWIDEALKYRKIFVGRKGYVNIDYVLSNFDDCDRKKILERVRKRIVVKNYLSNPLPIGSTKYSLGILYCLLKYLRATDVNEINRFYLPKDYSRLRSKKFSFIWDIWSPADVKENIQRFFKEYSQVHDNFIKSFFPNLADKFYYFKEFDRVIVILNVKEEYNSWEDSAGADFYYLKNKNKKENVIDVYLSNEDHPFVKNKPEFNKDIKIGGETYQIVSESNMILHFIFEDLPMMEYLYKELLYKFEKFLKNTL